MSTTPAPISPFGKWTALTAALLGWLFDGLEMGLFPLVAKPALAELVDDPNNHTKWLGIITALFLVGAATGGVLFGWLGDRVGRVRAMMYSVLTYALVSALGGFVTEAWQLGLLRFLAALGMGGEWSLGVALINEIWPDRSRVVLAGLIGAVANIGYMLIAVVGMGLDSIRRPLAQWLLGLGFEDSTVSSLVSWRLLMIICAVPALLTFFIRLYVPESARWLRERASGATSHWANRDLLGVLFGSVGACGIVAVWAMELSLAVRLIGTVVGFAAALTGYLFPVLRYLQRTELHGPARQSTVWPTLRLMLLAACLSGVALIGTWGTTQQAPFWSSTFQHSSSPEARSALVQFWTAFGAVIGTPLAALLAQVGRRLAYTILCAGSMAIIQVFYLTSTAYDDRLLFLGFLMGAITASFYGWLPLYLPELFPTAMRATGQGFGFNFGRILAAIGVLQLHNIRALTGWTFAEVCASLSGVYVVGMVLVWFAPETKGRPLPD